MGEGAGGERRFWPLMGVVPWATPAVNRPPLPRNPRGGGGATGEGRGMDTGRAAGTEQELIVARGIGKCWGRLATTAAAVASCVGVVPSVTARGLGWRMESLEMGLHAFSSNGLNLVRALLFLLR